MADQVLATKALCKDFGQSSVLADVDFSIGKGETVCILGPSGSGKTTLLRCLNLLVEPTSGQLYFRGTLFGEWPLGRGDRTRISQTKSRTRASMARQRL